MTTTRKLELVFLDTTNFSKPLQDMVLEVHSLHFSAESEEVFTLRLLMWELIWSEKFRKVCLKIVLKTLLPLLITSETTLVT